MRFTRFTAALGVILAAATAMLFGPATAAHADGTGFPPRTFRASMHIFVHDQDGPDPDDVGEFDKLTTWMTVSTTQNAGGSFSVCVDEVRIEIAISGNLDVAGHVRTRTTMKLYEGASCNSDDLDGTSPTLRDGAGDPPTVTEPQTLRVNNTDEYSSAEIVAMDCDFAILTQRLEVV